MSSPDKQQDSALQRLQIEISEADETDEVKILLQRFDENLGWYTASSLSFPREQVMLLQQSLQHIDGFPKQRTNKVIPFPTLCT